MLPLHPQNRKDEPRSSHRALTTLFCAARRALSSVGSERLPYKQRVGGSNPSAPTRGVSRSFFGSCGNFFLLPAAMSMTTKEPVTDVSQTPMTGFSVMSCAAPPHCRRRPFSAGVYVSCLAVSVEVSRCGIHHEAVVALNFRNDVACIYACRLPEEFRGFRCVADEEQGHDGVCRHFV